MSRHHETNPHFLPRQRDPVIEFPSQTPPPRSRPPQRYHNRTPIEVPPRGRTPIEVPPHGHTSLEAPPHGRTPPYPPTHHPPTHVKPVTPLQVEVPHTPRHSASEPDPHTRPPHGHGHGHGHGHHHHPAFIHPPSSRRTKPVAWLVAAFCTLFWILVIVAGLIILIVYLVFRPRSPRFDISSVTMNAAYLDMGYLLNADVRVLANFSNPNSKVKVEFSYVILDLYYANNFIATRYIEPFSVMRGESRFADVHMVASQVGLTRAHSMQLQKQMEQGRVNLEIKGLFKTRSKLGGIFKYSYWMYAHCQLVVTGPPTGVLIGKKCITKR